MRLLLDACVDYRLAAKLSLSGHDVVHCLDWAPHAVDSEIAAQAVATDRVVLTHDKAFYVSLVGLQDAGCGLFRFDQRTLDAMVHLCDLVLEEYRSRLEQGYHVIAKDQTIRAIPPWKKRLGQSD